MSRTMDRTLASAQRTRILDAAVQVTAQRGVAGATVGLTVARAGVSKRTFYELFDGMDGALIAVVDWGLERVTVLVMQAFERERSSWLDGMRAAMGAVLAFFDSAPDLARVLLVESLAGSPRLLEHRKQAVEAFQILVTEQIESEVSHASPLAAEGALAAVMGIVYGRLVEREPQPLIELLGPLMGTLAAPFVDDREVALEIARGEELARAILTERARRPAKRTTGLGEEWTAAYPGALPGALGERARRARECLLFLSDHPDASNREIAVGIGVAHASQISRLLGHLAERELVSKRCEGTGKRNAWRLTPRGEELARSIGDHSQWEHLQ